jgi:hypothetical protein
MVDKPMMFNDDLGKYVKDNHIRFLSYRNADFRHVKQLSNFVGFHVVRDPRDLLVSAYFSHLYSHPTKNWPALVSHRSKLMSMEKDEGLLLDMQFNQIYMDEMYTWDYQVKNVLQLRMEDIVKQPLSHFRTVFRFMGLMISNPTDNLELLLRKVVRRTARFVKSNICIYNQKLTEKQLIEILNSQDFIKKTGGRAAGQEDVKSHYRKGVSGDWVNHMKEMHIQYFIEHYNPVLLKLGYETDANWAEPYLISAKARD